MVNHVYREADFGWALRATGFVFLGFLIMANILVKSRLKPTPKKLDLMAHIRPLQEPPFALVALACFFFAMSIYLPGTFITLDAIMKGMQGNLAGYLLSILNASR
jgi:predicted permease